MVGLQAIEANEKLHDLGAEKDMWMKAAVHPDATHSHTHSCRCLMIASIACGALVLLTVCAVQEARETKKKLEASQQEAEAAQSMVSELRDALRQVCMGVRHVGMCTLLLNMCVSFLLLTFALLSLWSRAVVSRWCACPDVSGVRRSRTSTTRRMPGRRSLHRRHVRSSLAH